MGTTKGPLSRRGLGHVIEFRNFGTPLITFERMEISAVTELRQVRVR